MDKVGKTQAALKEGAQLQASVQSAQIQKKTEERTHTVNEAQTTGEDASPEGSGTEQVRERQGRGGGYSKGRNGVPGEGSAEDEEDRPDIIRDPDLGRNLDVSG
jgi:hypothetical protein